MHETREGISDNGLYCSIAVGPIRGHAADLASFLLSRVFNKGFDAATTVIFLGDMVGDAKVLTLCVLSLLFSCFVLLKHCASRATRGPCDTSLVRNNGATPA